MIRHDPAAIECVFIDSPEKLPLLACALTDAERVAIDTEVPIGGERAGQLRVMSAAVRLASGRELAFVVDARDVPPNLLAPLLDGVEADAWNANFDARVIDAAVWNTGDTTPHLTWWDGILADALLFQGCSGFAWYHGLAWATEHYLSLEVDGKGTTQLSYSAFDDLSDEQVRYAADDALHTLWVCDELRRLLEAADLVEVNQIEQSARPFLDQMERTGLPFDWDGWRRELDRMTTERQEALSELAMLTGGGQGSLFDESITPSWNPASEPQVRAALNRWASAEVEAWTRQRYGHARPLTDFDSVSARVLTEIGGPLAKGLLTFRNLTKILSTYGDNVSEYLAADGRIRPQYLQVVGTNTGRLASRHPNAQNFAAAMKPYFRPSEADRVFVHADLSQAELRFLAQVADDEPLRAAFARGEDVHVTTAASMFGFDPEQLVAEDPSRFKHLRQIAKALNFGIAYGTGATSLARSLTAEGTPTTREEAVQLLAQYRATYPGTARWAEDRIAEIEAVKARTDSIHWPTTLRLARGFATVARLRREFRQSERRWPTVKELYDRHPDRLTGDRSDLLAEIEWLTRYSAPVALCVDGSPFTFASRTLAGRRQQFNIHLDRLFLSVALAAVRRSDPPALTVRSRFEAEHRLDLDPIGGDGYERDDSDLARPFEHRPLRLLYVEAMADELGWPAVDRALYAAARERVSAMVNAWRNAPIQGGVADIMLVAYADLHERLQAFDMARPVQTVHDSIAVECFQADAEAVAQSVGQALEAASQRFCPDVVPRASVDIRPSLADLD